MENLFIMLELFFPMLFMFAPNTHVNLKEPIHIVETEPYLEDNLWHLLGSSVLLDINREVLNNELKQILLTSVVGLEIEYTDHITGVGFSLSDIGSNSIGILYSVLKNKYPNLPIEVRIGVKSWKELTRSLMDKDRYNILMDNHYSVMRSEVLYYHSNFFAGLLISKKEKDDDLFGLIVGKDVVKINKYINLSINLTYWVK